MIMAFFSKFGLKILIVLGIALGLMGALWMYGNNIREAVYQEFYAEQVNNALKAKEKEITTLNGLMKLREDSIRDLNAKNTKTHTDLDLLRRRIDNDKTVDACEVSPVLKTTIDEIKRMLREKETNGK